MKNLRALNRLYSYRLPKELIAQKPAGPRDRARLLIYSRADAKTYFDTFVNLPKYLPKNSVLIFNQTRVIPARLPLYKQTGGRVEVLYISHNKKTIRVLANRKLAVGDYLSFLYGREKKTGFKILGNKDGLYSLKSLSSNYKIRKIFKIYGLTPLPPYMKNSPLSEKQRRQAYQTMFAKTGESVAAPTASLHFTPRLVNSLKKQGVAIKFVRLNINLGTFAPLKEQQLQSGKLHEEKYFISAGTAKFIANAKKAGRPIIGVGTTVARTLESYAKSKKLSGKTKLFIRPGFNFRLINGLVTNFHVPKSSLLMLVSAFMGRKKLLKTYRLAIKKQFRFFSFGDGMLII